MEKNLSVLQITLVMLPGSQEEPWALAVVYGMSLWTAAEESRRKEVSAWKRGIRVYFILKSSAVILVLSTSKSTRWVSRAAVTS